MKTPDNPFQFEKAEDSSGFLLWQVTNLWQRGIKKALKKHGLAHSQFVLLASIHWLTLSKQSVTQILLSSHTKIDPMSTSTVLRSLQEKGLLRRQEHETDTRAKTISLTEKGVKMVNQAVKTVEQFDNEFFSPLGKQAKDFNKKLSDLLSGNMRGKE